MYPTSQTPSVHHLWHYHEVHFFTNHMGKLGSADLCFCSHSSHQPDIGLQCKSRIRATVSCTVPVLSPASTGLTVPTHTGQPGWVDPVSGYILQCFTHLETVTHPSTNCTLRYNTIKTGCRSFKTKIRFELTEMQCFLHVAHKDLSSNRLQLCRQCILRMFVFEMLFVCFWVRHLCLHHEAHAQWHIIYINCIATRKAQCLITKILLKNEKKLVLHKLIINHTINC